MDGARKLRLGSSPLTRGKRTALNADGTHIGLIPAHAGKTALASSSIAPAAAHPRSLGENELARVSGEADEGSSPLTRGKHQSPIVGAGRSGLIPAHAGKTEHRSQSDETGGAHPRSRGENAIQSAYKHSCSGSSPLTRGKPPPPWAPDVARGLIPAHAGKTTPSGASPRLLTAHPRSRGENLISVADYAGKYGSSPLTRGKRRRLGVRVERLGLIPAHAGKTLPDLRFYRADRSDLGKP